MSHDVTNCRCGRCRFYRCLPLAVRPVHRRTLPMPAVRVGRWRSRRAAMRATVLGSVVDCTGRGAESPTCVFPAGRCRSQPAGLGRPAEVSQKPGRAFAATYRLRPPPAPGAGRHFDVRRAPCRMRFCSTDGNPLVDVRPCMPGRPVGGLRSPVGAADSKAGARASANFAAFALRTDAERCGHGLSPERW